MGVVSAGFGVCTDRYVIYCRTLVVAGGLGARFTGYWAIGGPVTAARAVAANLGERARVLPGD